MVISISSRQVDCVRSSIGFYIFRHAKDPNAVRTMEWLCAMCDFYKELESKTTEDDERNISVSPVVAQYLPEMIQKYIFSEIDEMGDCDFDWLCEMTHIYQQLCNTEVSSEKSFVSENKEDDDNVSADGQEQKRNSMTEFEQFVPDQMSIENDTLGEDDFVDLSQPEDELF